MFYSMARRSGKIQDWATASKAHHNHQRGRCHGLRFRPLTASQGLGSQVRKTPASPGCPFRPLEARPVSYAWGCFHARTTHGLVCSALACGMMHGASTKARICPTHASAKPSWRCQAAWASQKVRSGCVTRIRAARKSMSGPQPARGLLWTNSGFRYRPIPTS